MCTETYCDNHFIMYVSQIIMLYTLSVSSAVCQLYLHKTGRKKKKEKRNEGELYQPGFLEYEIKKKEFRKLLH